MTLKEKFIKESLDIRYQVLEPEKFEQIADDYAMKFLHWYLNNDDIKKFSYSYKYLLEEFKKEKYE
jgi:hypothetical protein